MTLKPLISRRYGESQIALLALLLVLLLTACATPAPDPVRVSVPVPVIAPCTVTVPPRPAWAVDSLPLGAGVGRQMRALRADRLRALAHIGVLEGVAGACAAQ